MYLSTSNIIQNEENINTILHIPSLLQFDFNQSKCIISPDNSFAIFFNNSIILNVDLKSKKVKWFQKFENDEEISDVQINSNNQISFIKKLDYHNEIISLSSTNCTEYNELKIKDNILAYKLFQIDNSNDVNDILLIINDLFQIFLYKDNILENSFSRNIINDMPKSAIQINNKIINIEYLFEQRLILIFFDNGIIVIYSINNDENKNLNEGLLEFENYINLNSDEDSQYIYHKLKIHKNNYICDNQKGEMDIDNKSDSNSLNENNGITTFLTICTNKKNLNRRKSTIYFFKIENGKFVPIKELNVSNLGYNKITFDNKEIVDSSIFKYKINSDENDMSDYIFILFKQINMLNNNKFLFSTEYSNIFCWYDLNKEIDENNNKFQIFELFEELSNSHIYINNINLCQKKPRIFTVSYCKLGEKIISFEHNNKNLYLNNQNINQLLNSNNYEDYLVQLNSINFNEEKFNENIRNKYKELYGVDLDEELFNMRNDNLKSNDITKINYFLLNLISNQSLFKIKNYLLRKNPLNTGYIFPIEQICLTCNFLLKCLKNKIRIDGERNNEIEKLFNIIINILKIVQNRNKAYNDKLFGGEKDIMMEQESFINSMIFDAETLLFIYKIQLLYNDILNLNKNKINNEIDEEIKNAFFTVISLQKKEENANDKLEDTLNNLHLIYLGLFTEENLQNLFNPKTNNPITLNALLYYIKFVLFTYYFYFIYPKINQNKGNIDGNDLSKSEYFKKILPEYKNYYDISKVLFILDNSENEPNVNLSYLIKLLQYISKENLIMNKEINKILHLNRIIFEFIDALKEKKYYNEALTIGNSLFSFLSKFDEYNSYLICILELKDYPLAYSFLNNCLLLYYQNVEQDDKIKKFIHSEAYYEIKKSYYIFYEYLIRNQAIDVLFKLYLNFIEIYIFKELCEENEKYRDFLIIYYIIIGNIKEAKYCFQKYINVNNDNDSQSKILYANLIKFYESFMNKKFQNEKADELIEKLCTHNKFLLNFDDKKERRNLIDKIENENNIKIGYLESLMKSSILENKIISGLNFNVDDYDNFSTNLMTKLTSNLNSNLSSNYLSKENKHKLIKMNEIKPFNNSQINSFKFKNSNSNFNI